MSYQKSRSINKLFFVILFHTLFFAFTFLLFGEVLDPGSKSYHSKKQKSQQPPAAACMQKEKKRP
jgi:ATP/ADP translocase